MVRILYLVLIICNPILDIDNKALEREIIHYVRTVKEPGFKKQYPYVTINDLKADTVEYQISYFFSSAFLECQPIAFFAKIDSLLVPVQIKGFLFKDEFLFKLKEKSIRDCIALYFPEDLIYYQECNTYPPPPTARVTVWKLVFKGNKLIKKNISIE